MIICGLFLLTRFLIGRSRLGSLVCPLSGRSPLFRLALQPPPQSQAASGSLRPLSLCSSTLLRFSHYALRFLLTASHALSGWRRGGKRKVWVSPSRSPAKRVLSVVAHTRACLHASRPLFATSKSQTTPSPPTLWFQKCIWPIFLKTKARLETSQKYTGQCYGLYLSDHWRAVRGGWRSGIAQVFPKARLWWCGVIGTTSAGIYWCLAAPKDTRNDQTVGFQLCCQKKSPQREVLISMASRHAVYIILAHGDAVLCCAVPDSHSCWN